MNGVTRGILIVCLLGATAGAARAQADDLADVSAVKAKLQLVTDGKGHYVAFVPLDSDNMYWGDGKDFWAQRVFGYSGEDDGKKSFDMTFWEPRVGGERWKAGFEFKDKKYQMRCDDRITELKLVPPAEAKPILDGAKFHKTRWKHQAYALARDTRGTYYFVDKQREPEGSKLFRVWTGQKGAMKPAKMKNQVSDSEGDIFVTRNGQLRLVLDKSESTWVKGKKSTKLTVLPVEDNVVLIYSELGVYAGQSLGTPCDDI